MTIPETTFPLPWQPEINPTWLEKISESKVNYPLLIDDLGGYEMPE